MADADAELDLVLDRAITAPMAARAAVRALIHADLDPANVEAGRGHDAFSQLALLATSEIVTHSLSRGTGPCHLRAWHAASGWLRVEVVDHAGLELPALHGDGSFDSELDSIDSLRLAVLLEVASAWGVDHSPFGRTTWFELAR